jgi:hypothetical protein
MKCPHPAFGHLLPLRSAQREKAYVGLVPSAVADDTGAGAFEIEIIGERRRATIITAPPFDPEGKRMRG